MARLLLTLAPLLLVAASAAAQTWVEVRSPNFSVFTDAGEKRGQEVALRFEQMRNVFGTLFLKDKVNIPVPLQIIAFRNSKDYKAVAPPSTAGFFQSGDDRQFIALDLSLENRWEAVFHEYAHQLLNGNNPDTAAWFDEGFAEYFSTLRISDKEVEFGRPPQRATARLHLRPVAELFRIERDSKLYQEGGEARSEFYAQSWLVVRYLMDGQHMPKVARYFSLVNDEGVSVEDAVQQAFGKSVQQFDVDLAAYLRLEHGKLWRVPLKVPLQELRFSARPLDALDMQVNLLELRLRSPQREQAALKELEALSARHPQHAGAQRVLGYNQLRRGEYAAAADHLRRAATLDPRDPWAHYYSGLLAIRRAIAAGQPPEELEATKRHLQTALDLDPNMADAYSLLSFVNMVETDLPAAIEHARRALERSPRNEHYALNLCRAYFMGRQHEKAAPLLEHLRRSQHDDISGPANQLYAQLELARRSLANLADRKPLDSYDAPQWRRKTPENAEEEKSADAPPDTRPTRYLRGTLLAVDCSPQPGAVLTVLSSGRRWKLRVADRQKLVLIAADQLDCAWKDRKVLVNYRASGEAEGDVTTLELQ